MIALAILFAILFPFLPASTDGLTPIIRAMMGTFGMAVSAILAPTLLYAGLRTKNRTDAFVGMLGVISLWFWIAWIVFP